MPEDAEALCRLNREFNGNDTACAAQIRRSLQSPGAEHCFVCLRDERAVGFICGVCFSSLCYAAPVAQITELYVQPDARRSGCGEALVRAMTGHLRSLGAAEILLLTGDDNLAAQALYEKCGFVAENEKCFLLQTE